LGSFADRLGRIAAPAIVLLAGALGTLWAFLVPIFQGPDEPAHFDYAISIFSAERLVRVADGQTDWIVSPYTKYLMRAVDQERIAWHSSMRVPAGYGTAAYFARVDAGAPNPRAVLAPEGKISYLVPAYPFAFYALEAVWMRAVSLFTGSLVALFFAARLLCVFLAMLGLYFNYRTALNLRICTATAAALTAGIAFFPLVTFVSSYVQPDNLSYALVSVTLFFATALRPGTLRPATVAGLGLSLGLLAVTKYQFFLGCALPIVPLAAVRLVQAKPSAWQRLQAIVAIAAPAAVLLAVQHFLVGQAAQLGRPAQPSDMNFDFLRATLALGAPAALRYALDATLAAIAGCFVHGSCAASFWQVAGWMDTPIVVVNAAIELVLRATIGLLSLAVLSILLFSLVRNALRLLGVAARGHFRDACVVAVADPALNAYLCFLAIMLALYVVTNNAFGAEGRQLYPFVFPAFLCFVWYAPRALTKRHQRASAALAVVLACYSLLAAGYALSDVLQRYYAPQSARYTAASPAGAQVSAQTAGVLWPVVSAEYHVASSRFAYAFPSGSRLLADGSAVLPDGEVPSSVAVILDGTTALPVLSDQFLYPVAEAANSLADGYSGFYATILTAGMREGAHTVAAYAALPAAGRYDTIPPLRLFFLTADDGRFSGAFLRALSRAVVIPGSILPAGACRSGAALVRGSIAGAQAARIAAVWLLAEDRPFPARYDPLTGAFVGAVPSDFSPQTHSVVAYAIPVASLRYLRIEGAASLSGAPNAPPECADPLRQLQGP